MFRLGFLLGLFAGAISVLLMQEPEAIEEAPEGESGGSRLDSARRQFNTQLQKARQAARDEAKAKEEEMRRAFEETVHRKKE